MVEDKNFTMVIKLLILIGLGFFVGVVISRIIIQINVVSGNSMHPTLDDGDYGITIKATYRLLDEDYNRDDIVTLRFPNENRVFIKRIIGLPNEHIEIIAGDILIDNVKYEDSYRNPIPAKELIKGDAITVQSAEILEEYRRIYSLNYGNYYEVKLGDNEYFCLGDNRFYSTDSRILGPVEKKDIQGKFYKLEK